MAWVVSKYTRRVNLIGKALEIMAKVIFTSEEREREKMAKRMDKFDAVVNEYLRANRFTTDELSLKLGINKSTLWRYRRQVYSFEKAPFGTITHVLRLANCPNDVLRYICGM